MSLTRPLIVIVMSSFVAFGAPVVGVRASDCNRTSVGLTPVSDLGPGRYLDRYPGGLYPEGWNAPPPAHIAEGLRRANAVTPLNRDGRPDPAGKVVLLSIGMSNTTQEFCGGNPCRPGSFAWQAQNDGRVNHVTLEIVDGAAGGQTAQLWDSPDDPNYDRVRDTRLAPRGLTEAQVQAVWVKVANASPRSSLPNADADANRLLEFMGGIARAIRVRYPNAAVVFWSSRIYAGYASTPLNPEPYAYESGFAVKWLIEAQITQMRTGFVDPRAGDLDYDTAAPWLAWGAYLWADGLVPRSDGLIWKCEDLASDGTHPSASGVEKVGRLLLDFMLVSPFAAPWFAAEGGVECGDVRRLTAMCRRGRLKVTAKLADEAHDGAAMIVRVDDAPAEMTVRGRKARLIRRPFEGSAVVELLTPADCRPAIPVACR